MEDKIEIPDNCELVKENNTYIVKEKNPRPKTWEDFCRNYPITETEYFIGTFSDITNTEEGVLRTTHTDRNLCVSKEEAEAFLALMQLRQLRKAWIGDWEQPNGNFSTAAILYSISQQKIIVDWDRFWTLNILSFPTKRMAEEFLECFKDLCETAKILL